jgi:hypothetical protein
LFTALDNEQRLSARDDVARLGQQLDDAARIGREDRRRAVFIDGNFSFRDMFAAECLFGHRLDGKRCPFRRAWHVARKPGSVLARHLGGTDVLRPKPRHAEIPEADCRRQQQSQRQPFPAKYLSDLRGQMIHFYPV